MFDRGVRSNQTDNVSSTRRGQGWSAAVVASVAIAAALALGAAGSAAAGGPGAGATSGSATAQAAWVLAKLNGGGVTQREVQARFAPAYLRVVMPAGAVAEALNSAGNERRPFRFVRYARRPTATQAIAVVSTRSRRVAIRVSVAKGKIDALEVTAPPPPVDSGGRFTGKHDVGGRKLMLRCVGRGAPTVVLESPRIEDWYALQQRLARITRVCAYDRANARWGQSDPASTPRSGNNVAADLRALLRAAGVPRPYVLVGHSNAGLFAQVFASRHPQLTAGLVLVDAVTATYYDRDLALLEKHLPREEYVNIRNDLLRGLPAIIDPERLDIGRSQSELRALLALRPLPPLPLFVLSHGRAPEPVADPRGEQLSMAREELWQQLQRELAQLVPRARHLVASRSGHDIPREQPDLVVVAITAVVAAVRHPDRW